jgi:hypothetical protein
MKTGELFWAGGGKNGTTLLVLWVFSWIGAKFLLTVTTFEVLMAFTFDELKFALDCPFT